MIVRYSKRRRDEVREDTRGRIGQDSMRPGGAVQGPTFGSRTDMGQLEGRSDLGSTGGS